MIERFWNLQMIYPRCYDRLLLSLNVLQVSGLFIFSISLVDVEVWHHVKSKYGLDEIKKASHWFSWLKSSEIRKTKFIAILLWVSTFSPPISHLHFHGHFDRMSQDQRASVHHVSISLFISQFFLRRWLEELKSDVTVS